MLVAITAMLITMFGMPQTTQAATKYGFHVGGVYVTSDNYTNITGNDIKPYDENTTDNAVWYDPATNTLYVKNTRIERMGGNKQCIENETNGGLTIMFIGKCYFYSKNSEAIRLRGNTTLMGNKENPKPEIYAGSNEYGAIHIENNSQVTIENLYIKTESAKNHAILGDAQESLALKNVDITCFGTGDNKAAVANFLELTLENSHISTGSNAKKTYGIRADCYRSIPNIDLPSPKIFIFGTSTITTMHPAIHVNGSVHIEGQKDSKLEATSLYDCAIYLDWTSRIVDGYTHINSGFLNIHCLNFKFKGLSSGIRGNRYEDRERPTLIISLSSGIVKAEEAGSGVITNIENFEICNCKIEEPEGAYFDKDKHALCDANGNVITDKVIFSSTSNFNPTGVETINTYQPATVSEIYSADGRRQSQMRRGLNIIRMTDGITKKVIVK